VALSAIFIGVSLIRLNLVRKSWKNKFKRCATASNYQLRNYENPTIAMHDIHATAHHSSTDKDSGLWCMMSCWLLNS